MALDNDTHHNKSIIWIWFDFVDADDAHIRAL